MLGYQVYRRNCNGRGGVALLVKRRIYHHMLQILQLERQYRYYNALREVDQPRPHSPNLRSRASLRKDGRPIDSRSIQKCNASVNSFLDEGDPGVVIMSLETDIHTVLEANITKRTERTIADYAGESS